MGGGNGCVGVCCGFGRGAPVFEGGYYEDYVDGYEGDETQNPRCCQDCEHAGIRSARRVCVWVFDVAFVVVYVAEGVVAAAKNGAFLEEFIGLFPGF